MNRGGKRNVGTRSIKARPDILCNAYGYLLNYSL